MARYEINGGNPLNGTVTISGAKNAAVAILPAALLVKGIRFNLQNEGYNVVTGSNGLEAVTMAQNGDVDLIVLDVMMPGMDGFTLCKELFGNLRE